MSHVRESQRLALANPRRPKDSLRACNPPTRRIAAPVGEEGHDVPRRDVIRRFKRACTNYQKSYRPVAESWAVYDNS
jgi:predicted ABC-type ATPase